MPIQVISSSSPPRSIAIVKLDHRGDFLLACPALRRIFSVWPNADIDFVCGSWNKDSANAEFRFRDVICFNYFIEESDFSNKLSRPSEWRKALSNILGNRHYDLVIDLRVDADTRHLLNAFNCKMKAGFGNPDLIPYLDIGLDLKNPTLINVARNCFLPIGFFRTTCNSAQLGNCIFIRGSRGATKSLLPAIESNHFQLLDRLTTFKPIIKFLAKEAFLSYEFVDTSNSTVITAGCLDDEALNEGIVIRSSENINSVSLRIYTTKKYPLPLALFYGLSITNEGRFTGPHQTEMMEMLITLCESRLSSRVPSSL